MMTLSLFRQPRPDWDGELTAFPFLAIVCEECGFTSQHMRWNSDLAIKEMEQHQIVVHSRPL